MIAPYRPPSYRLTVPPACRRTVLPAYRPPALFLFVLCLSLPLLAADQDHLPLNGGPAAQVERLAPNPEPRTPNPEQTRPNQEPRTKNQERVSSNPVSSTILDDKQKLGIGDRISYRVIEDQDDPKSLIITDAGDIEVPYFGLVPAVNKTCKQLAEEIKGRLEKQYYYRATVIIALEIINKKRTLGKVYVVGQVRMTGPQEIPTDEVFTVSKAILGAGGFSDFADKKKVRLVRRTGPNQTEKQTYLINVSDIWEKGKIETDIAVEPEDLIFVPGRLMNF